MDSASLYYLGMTLLLFVIFAALAARTLRRNNRERGEAPKYRMMDDDEPIGGERPPRSRRTGRGKKEDRHVR